MKTALVVILALLLAGCGAGGSTQNLRSTTLDFRPRTVAVGIDNVDLVEEDIEMVEEDLDRITDRLQKVLLEEGYVVVTNGTADVVLNVYITRYREGDLAIRAISALPLAWAVGRGARIEGYVSVVDARTGEVVREDYLVRKSGRFRLNPKTYVGAPGLESSFVEGVVDSLKGAIK